MTDMNMSEDEGEMLGHEAGKAETSSPFLAVDNIDPKTGRVLETPVMDPEYPGIVFPGFEAVISPFGAYIVRKGNLWWSARCVWRDGSEDAGMYGVLVTCRDNHGNIVAFTRSPHVWPRKMHGANVAMWQAANRLASAEEADALRRARMGMSVRPVSSGHSVTLYEEPGVDERGVRRAGSRTLAKTPEPYRDSVRPFGRRYSDDDEVLMPRHTVRRQGRGLSADVGQVADSVRRAVTKGEEAT